MYKMRKGDGKAVGSDRPISTHILDRLSLLKFHDFLL
jgi:hypothetical protein